ncbi:MAG: sugar phosphate isomerase/epimerase family protein [Verrucomicrobiota bacterium JB025]|nr:sugar phosphate isomerase/epimerase [Verrucomicrobiota bacterium JB025]
MKRRSLLTMIPAASAVLAMRSTAHGAAIPAEALTAAGFSIAVQLWSFRKFTLLEALEMAAAAGAGGVEMYPGQRIGGEFGKAQWGPEATGEQVEAVTGALRKHGLKVVNYGVTKVSKKEDEARKVFGFVKQLGGYGVTTESLDALDVMEKLAAEYDLKVCFHNHPRPTPLWNPDKVWDAVQGRHENVGFCADLGHWASSGLDPLEVIRKVAPRVRAFHMKDRESLKEWTHDRPFGTGAVDLVAILDAVRGQGFAGNVSIEYEHNWDRSLAEVAQCVGYLRGYSRVKG